MKKKFMMIFALILIVSSLGQVVSAAGKEVTVTVDSKKVNFPDGKPIMEENRVLIPVRFVSEALGAKVDYKNQTVLIKQSEKNISMKVNTSIVTTGDKKILLDVPARLQKGRVYVPLRFVSEALGAQVDWNSKKFLVTITTASATTKPADPKDPEQKPEEKQEQPKMVFKPFAWEEKTDLGKALFKNNMKYSNGQVTFTVPEGAEASYLSLQAGMVKLKQGQKYTYSAGVGSITFGKIYAKDDLIEGYTVFLDTKDESLGKQFINLTDDVVVYHGFVKKHKSVETAGTLKEAIAAAQSL
ncbi:copper amine oxidase N-terminal domain-containing protein [Paenibacillus farraposensis]|uniref:copper amine oxidase N-terminal domain-containing protein n=1 Tax=Paenibacillus farraposensis TaxID=2807095 RepID=UPI001E500CCF|nr:copper amine oxidase N-terminal domain-containing protein [Paenibacillus farraposensis]MCC3378776.1 copper amine oxidase N-terminal domain-containing protein [Paenibacillus farraposensis]